MLDTTNWAKFEFSVGEHTFVSLMDQASPIYPKAVMLPREILDSINTQAILDLIGDVDSMTRQEIQDKLTKANENASYALLELV